MQKQGRYLSFNRFLREKFNGEKTWKIPINAHFGCPNKDGSVSSEGCIYCDRYSSGMIRTFHLPITEQIEQFVQGRPERRFLAYFQANSNTHAPVKQLRAAYETIYQYPNICGLFLGTRPDAIADDVYPLLEEMNRKTYLCVELGLQSIHSKSLVFLKRNHDYETFVDTFEKLKSREIDIVVHLILGIPGETEMDMLESVREMNRLKPTGIKFHLMHLLKDTELLERFRQTPFKLYEMDEYTDLVVHLLENLDPEIVIHRLTGERDRELFMAPLWALDKARTIQMIRDKLEQKDTWQGRLLQNRIDQY